MIPTIFPDKEYLKGLIKSLLKEGLLKELIEEDSEIREMVQAITSEYLITKSGVPQRLAAVEQVTGIEDYEDESEEHKITLVDRVAALEEEKTVLLALRTAVDSEFKNLPQSKTDYRADYLIKYMEQNGLKGEGDEIGKPDTGIPRMYSNVVKDYYIYIDTPEFRKFIDNFLPEKFLPKSKKNLRKIKSDVFRNAARRYPSKVWTHNLENGNHELRLLAFFARSSVTE